jgi:hypothetical protein
VSAIRPSGNVVAGEEPASRAHNVRDRSIQDAGLGEVKRGTALLARALLLDDALDIATPPQPCVQLDGSGKETRTTKRLWGLCTQSMDDLLSYLATLPLGSVDAQNAVDTYVLSAADPLSAGIELLNALGAAVLRFSPSASVDDDTEATAEGGPRKKPAPSGDKPTGPPVFVLLTAHFATAARCFSALLPPGSIPPAVEPELVTMASSLPVPLLSRLVEALCSGGGNETRIINARKLKVAFLDVVERALASGCTAAAVTIVVNSLLYKYMKVTGMIEDCARRNLLGVLAKLMAGTLGLFCVFRWPVVLTSWGCHLQW